MAEKNPIHELKQAAYRATLANWWRCWLKGPELSIDEAMEAMRAVEETEVGVENATQVRTAAARAWHQKTGVCPYCGDKGPFHEPEIQAR